eukprot:g25557.t1
MGLDCILVIVLKTCAPELAVPLAKHFQYSYNTGIYPTTWKLSSKAMEGVINSAMKQHLLSNNPLSDSQFVLCQSHYAPDLIIALLQTWTKELNSR